MTGFFGGLLFEIGIPLLILAVFGGGEYLLKRAGRRAWMWGLAAAWILFVLWYRGPGHFSSWLVAAAWFGLVVYIDRRVLPSGEPDPAHLSASPSQRVIGGGAVDDGPPRPGPSVGRHGQ